MRILLYVQLKQVYNEIYKNNQNCNWTYEVNKYFPCTFNFKFNIFLFDFIDGIFNSPFPADKKRYEK